MTICRKISLFNGQKMIVATDLVSRFGILATTGLGFMCSANLAATH